MRKTVLVLALLATTVLAALSACVALPPSRITSPTMPSAPRWEAQDEFCVRNPEILCSDFTAQSTLGLSNFSIALPLSAFNVPAADTYERKAGLRLLEVCNQERAKWNLPPFAVNEALMESAQHHSWDMAWRDFFSHTSSNGDSVWDRMRAAGYPLGDGSENISAGRVSAESVVRGWMTSAGHRDTLLDKRWVEAGAGLVLQMDDQANVDYPGHPASKGPYYTYWTLDVARPEGYQERIVK